MKIKICGMTDIDNISRILFLEPDYLGFIFYPKSPRYAVGRLKPEMLNIIPKCVKRVGVFVDAGEAEIMQMVQTYGLQVIQLHGHESVELCAQLKQRGLEVIKVFSISQSSDFDGISAYDEVVDYYLFDTKTKQYGGSGLAFEWQLILRQPIRKPWFLSGGIGEDNIAQAAQIGAYALDLNSKFEVQPGVKDYDRLQNALATIKTN